MGTSVTAVAGGCDEEDSDKDDGIHGNETALVTGSFQYNCYNCGKNGHKAHECPEKKGNMSAGPRSGTCEECGKRGHKKADCWEDDANASKRPRGWKSMKGERAGAAIEMYEILVANVEVDAFEMKRPFEMNDENKMTAQVTSGIVKNEMTAQVTSGIWKNEMTAQVTSGIGKNEMTAQVTSGIAKNEMTAQVTSGITKNEIKLKKETKLKQDEYEQRRMLERVAQTDFVSGSTYDTDDSVSHGREEMSQRGEREFRCSIARSEFGERKQ